MSVWSASLVDMRTGEPQCGLTLLGGGRWEDSDRPSATLTVAKGPLRELELDRWWVPWRAGVLLELDGHPVHLGPLTQVPTVGRDTVGLRVGSLWDVLDHRYATAADFRPGQGAELAGSILSVSGVSLGAIGWRLVQAAMARRGGPLPVVHGTTDQVAGHERSWAGFDVANLSVAHLLGLLAGVIGGPDIRFDPEWEDDSRQRARWVMRHGTVVSPRIVQAHTLSVDATSQVGVAGDLAVTCDWTPTAKIYAVGAGQEAGALMAVVEDEPLMLRVPLLEQVMADTSEDDLGLLTDRARGRLARSRSMTVQIDATVPLELLHPSLWHVGDLAQVHLGDEWWPLPAAMDATVVSRSADVGSGVVRVGLQAEVSLW